MQSTDSTVRSQPIALVNASTRLRWAEPASGDPPPAFVPHRHDRLPPYGSAPGAGSSMRPPLRSRSSVQPVLSVQEDSFDRAVRRFSREAARAAQQAEWELMGTPQSVSPTPSSLPGYRTPPSPSIADGSSPRRWGGYTEASPVSPYRSAATAAFGARSRSGGSVAHGGSPPQKSQCPLLFEQIGESVDLAPRARRPSKASITSPSFTMLKPREPVRHDDGEPWPATLGLFDEEVLYFSEDWWPAGNAPSTWEDARTVRAPSPEPGYLDRLLLVPSSAKLALASHSALSDPSRSESAAQRGELHGQAPIWTRPQSE